MESNDRLKGTTRHVEACANKLGRMAELFLARSTLGADHAQRISDAVSAVRWKLIASTVHLEDLWSLSERERLALPDLIANAVTKHSWSDRSTLEGTISLESFLFQSRALLDVYMRLICECVIGHSPVLMSRERFNAAMQSAEAADEERAKALMCYFDSAVFGPNQWGHLLKGLRDKIAHRDRLKPGREGSESIAIVRLDWPTIRGLSFERLAQLFDNGSFELLRSTTPALFELEWKSGPYDPEAWSNAV